MPLLAKGRQNESSAKYMCMFCSYRSKEKLQVGGCPDCGSAWPYGTVGALRALQIISGVVFISLSGFFLWFGSIGLQDKLRGEKISWAIVVILLGVGGILVAGAVSSFLGRSWLFRLLLVFFGAGLRRRPPGTQ
jgi:hypothetical protein